MTVVRAAFVLLVGWSLCRRSWHEVCSGQKTKKTTPPTQAKIGGGFGVQAGSDNVRKKIPRMLSPCRLCAIPSLTVPQALQLEDGGSMIHFLFQCWRILRIRPLSVTGTLRHTRTHHAPTAHTPHAVTHNTHTLSLSNFLSFEDPTSRCPSGAAPPPPPNRRATCDRSAAHTMDTDDTMQY
ncbi:hypothetical protein DFJ73DRAFT_584477 [Zopfochytrium polystomum]|nr:hypothetical protein DFJ73DRAFT_584477 [Zopfochytrium polystomum]